MIKTRNTLSERWWDMWVAIFAMGVVLIVSWRLWVTEWTGDLYILVFLTFFAGLTGLALGYSKFSPWWQPCFPQFTALSAWGGCSERRLTLISPGASASSTT